METGTPSHLFTPKFCCFGAAIGIAVYVATTTIIGDMQRQTQPVIAGYNTEVMVQSQWASTPMASRMSMEDFSALQPRFGENVIPLMVGPRREEWDSYVMILGTTPQLFSRLGLIEGKAPVAGRLEVMVGHLSLSVMGLVPARISRLAICVIGLPG